MQRAFYGNHARFDVNTYMTEDAIRAVAPSVFAVDKHDSRSDRFAPIPTIEILRGLAKEGFHVVGARQNVARTEDKKAYTKHLLRIRRFGHGEQYQVGGTVLEMYLQNANDGTSAYNLDAALFRIACLNSMCAKIATLDAVKVYHSGNSERVMGKVIEGTYRVLDNSQALLEAPRAWSGISLNDEETTLFARAAALVRWGNPAEETSEGEREDAITTYNPHGLLATRRPEDRGNDLWTTFNRVQENAIRGGVVGRTLGTTGNVRRATSRPVKAIDTDIKINKRLFDLADAFAQLKGAATITGANPAELAMA